MKKIGKEIEQEALLYLNRIRDKFPYEVPAFFKIIKAGNSKKISTALEALTGRVAKVCRV